jgi:hypothetical protein
VKALWKAVLEAIDRLSLSNWPRQRLAHLGAGLIRKVRVDRRLQFPEAMPWWRLGRRAYAILGEV